MSDSLLWPAVLAVAGYAFKSIYEIFLDYRKRNRELVESKLQNFYWPICIRLKKNGNVYSYLFKGKNNPDHESDAYKIANHVERNILILNHQEILSIITNFRYLADVDGQIGPLIDEYIKHVSIYTAFIESGIEGYPGVKAKAKYPSDIDEYFYNKTKALQEKLWKMKF
jgi:hypothetical protein